MSPKMTGTMKLIIKKKNKEKGRDTGKEKGIKTARRRGGVTEVKGDLRWTMM